MKIAFPERIAARIKLRQAVKAGRIQRKPCEKCGNKASEGHHSDYSKPYDVIWLCRKHHTEAHREELCLTCGGPFSLFADGHRRCRTCSLRRRKQHRLAAKPKTHLDWFNKPYCQESNWRATSQVFKLAKRGETPTCKVCAKSRFAPREAT